MSQNQLFSEFIASTKDDWLKKAALDLKGKSIDSLANNWYGLPIKPYYTEEDLGSSEIFSPLLTSKKGWINYVRIEVQVEEQANKLAHTALELGATGIVFNLNNPPDYSRLLAGIALQHCAIAFTGHIDVDDYLGYSRTITREENLTGFVDSAGTNENKLPDRFY